MSVWQRRFFEIMFIFLLKGMLLWGIFIKNIQVIFKSVIDINPIYDYVYSTLIF
jgi:hypothetical protein